MEPIETHWTEGVLHTILDYCDCCKNDHKIAQNNPKTLTLFFKDVFPCQILKSLFLPCLLCALDYGAHCVYRKKRHSERIKKSMFCENPDRANATRWVETNLDRKLAADHLIFRFSWKYQLVLLCNTPLTPFPEAADTFAGRCHQQVSWWRWCPPADGGAGASWRCHETGGGCWLRMPAGLRLEAGEPPGEARQPRYLFLGTPLSPSHLPAFHDQPANSYHAAFALNLIHPGNLQNNHLQ